MNEMKSKQKIFNNVRWQRFKKNRRAILSLYLFFFLSFVSLTAEFWANSKPIYLNYKGKNFYPIFINYHPSDFNRNDIFVMDYQSLKLDSSDIEIWPIIQWDPYQSNTVLNIYPSPPSRYNIWGTDDRGRDVFTRVLYGFRYTLGYAMGVWFLSYLIGVLFGVITGYLGGWVDLIGMRIVEIFDSVPTLLLLLTLIAIFNPNLYLLIGLSVCFGWTTIASYMRGEFLSLRKREFVESARSLGASHLRIIFKHILPNALSPIITFSPFMIAGNVLILTNMDYLGLGLPVPTPSWGELLGQAQKYFTFAEWLIWWPGLVLVLVLMLLMNIGLAIRDAFDSKM